MSWPVRIAFSDNLVNVCLRVCLIRLLVALLKCVVARLLCGSNRRLCLPLCLSVLVGIECDGVALACWFGRYTH